MNSKTSLSIFSILVLTAGFLATTPVLAATSDANETGHCSGNGQIQGHKNGIVGTVTSVSGNILVVSSHQGLGVATPATTYTIDASNAKITKAKIASNLAAVTVGTTVNIEGTISGNSIAATYIRLDCKGNSEGRGMNGHGRQTSSSSPIQGNGQPVIAGKVSSISGTVMTVTTNNAIVYTVDATIAKIVKGQAIIVITDIAIGDSVVVQGATNGTSIKATSIIDQSKSKVNSNAINNAGVAKAKEGNHQGFFGQFGSFFKNIFGF